MAYPRNNENNAPAAAYSYGCAWALSTKRYLILAGTPVRMGKRLDAFKYQNLDSANGASLCICIGCEERMRSERGRERAWQPHAVPSSKFYLDAQLSICGSAGFAEPKSRDVRLRVRASCAKMKWYSYSSCTHRALCAKVRGKGRSNLDREALMLGLLVTMC
ncbi:hypothetical protein KM043_012747 [Ampulex compressa]|nr:hypothetical protein KM043_012747 [Ampulex compressa]